MSNKETIPRSILFIYVLTFTFLASIIYSFTHVTQRMDDVKLSILYLGGPVLLCLYFLYARRGALRVLPASLFLPLTIYLLTLFFSTLMAKRSYSWIGWRETGFQIALLGAFFCGFGLIRSKMDIHRVLLIWTLLGLGTSLFGLFQYFGGFRLLHRALISDPNRQSSLSNLLNSFISNENEMFSVIMSRQFYAAFLVAIAPLTAAYVIVEKRSAFRRYLGVATGTLSAICLYLTHSKIGVGAFIVVAIAFFILYKRYAPRKEIRAPNIRIWITGFLIVGVTLGFFTSDISPAKLKSISRSLESRAIIWKGGWNMFLYGPGPDDWHELEGNPPLNLRSVLIGCGPGSFRLIFPRYRNPDYFRRDIGHITFFSHNLFIDLLAETGILGFLSYAALLIAFFARGSRALRKGRDGETRVYCVAFICSLLGILLISLFSPNARWTVMGTVLWAIWGMGFGAFCLAEDKVKETRTMTRDFSQRFPAPQPLVAKAFLAIMTALLPAIYFCGDYALIRFDAARHYYAGLFFIHRYANAYEREIEKLASLARTRPDKAGELNKTIAQRQQNVIHYHKRAIEIFNVALSLDPAFLSAYYNMASSRNATGDPDNALKSYLALQKFAPDYAEVHYNLGATYDALARRDRELSSTRGNEAESRSLLTRAEEMEKLSLRELKIAARMSSSSKIQKAYAGKLTQLQKYSEARKIYESLRKREPEEKLYLQWLAILAERQNNRQTALQYYTQMFEIDPLNDFIFNRIEQLYKTLDQPGALEDFLLKSLKTNPLNLKLRVRLLDLYITEKNNENARKQLTILTRVPDVSNMISRDPEKRQETLFNLAQKAGRLKHPEGEIFFLEKSLEINPASEIGKACAKRLKEISP